MYRKAYILTFDRDDTFNYKDIHEKITSLPDVINWFHYIKSSYILITNLRRATTLSQKIQDIMPKKRFLLIEVNLENNNGWLPSKAWDWINVQRDRIK